MRLCSYVVVIDRGFAPNPFWGFCTLAACTPNHQGLRLEAGDWLLGNSSTAAGRRIVYAMRVSEVLDFDEYYRDERFAAKKASAGDWRERCGDNIYFRDSDGEWAQGVAFEHTSQESMEQDTRHPRVFISDHFFYFGESAPEMPPEYRCLLQTRQGCTYYHGEVVSAFVDWLESTYDPGKLGEPRDRIQEVERKCDDVPAGREPPAKSCSTNRAKVSHYVDGFVLPVARDRLDEYERVAKAAAEIWREHGALDYWECVGDDLGAEGTRSFTDIAGAADNEAVVFAWAVFESREARDAANEKICADPRMADLIDPSNPVVDFKRMACGGFRPIVRVSSASAE